ncbi:MAG: NAD(P)H-hydrate dehydratase [Prochlorococcus sp.]
MSWPPSDVDHLLVTAAQMAALEEEMFASGLPIAALMEKVGQAMAAWFRQQPGLLANGVVVLVGPGHNGGDGLVVARELHLAGVKVQVWAPLPIRQSLTLQHWSYVNWLGIEQLQNSPDIAAEALWVEALFGLGQTRQLPETLASLLQARQSCQPGKLVSLDVPAGLCSDAGRPLPGGAAVASRTLTVGLIKQGLVQDGAIAHVGHLVRVDMGVPKSLLQQLPKRQPRRICSADLSTLPWPQPAPGAMKYQRGRVLVIAGSDDYLGAASLAIKGAIASGAGSIQAVVPVAVADQLWQVAPEVVLKAALDSSASGGMNVGPWLANHDLSRVDAILIGPGLGRSEESWSDMAEPLRLFAGLLVLDADALNRLALSNQGWQWLKQRQGPTWITPHLAEFRRLFPQIKDREPLDAAIEAARLCGVVVLLKGAHSVVADPSSAAWQLGETASWVARSGLGDLLAGYAAGLGSLVFATAGICQGESLAAVALLHAEAARRCQTGSSAGSIANSLAALTISMQSN